MSQPFIFWCCAKSVLVKIDILKNLLNRKRYIRSVQK